MLDYLRNKMKIILWITVIAFIGTIFISWGMHGAVRRAVSRVAVVNGDEITPQEYYQKLEQTREYYKQMLGDNFNEELLKQLNMEAQVMESLIRQRLLKQKAKDMGILVTDAEVLAKIKMMPQFQTAGQFDIAKYNAIVTNPRNNKLLPALEEEMRETLLTDKLELLIKNSAVVTEKEIRDLFHQKNDQFQFSYVQLNLIDYVPKDKVQQYYNEHADEFKTQERVQASHILFPIENNETEALEKAQKVYEEIKKGASFAKLAQQYSADSTAKAGGELGYFSKRQMVPEFEEVAFRLKVGEVSEPVKTKFGYHIIKVTDHKPGSLPPLKEVYDNVAQKVISDNEKTAVNDLLVKMKAKAGEFNSLEKGAKAQGFAASSSKLFKQGEKMADDLPWQEELWLAVNTLTLNQISEPVSDGKSVFLLQLKEHIISEEKDFQKQQLTLKDELLSRKREEIFNNWYDALRSSAKVTEHLKDYEKAAKDYQND